MPRTIRSTAFARAALVVFGIALGGLAGEVGLHLLGAGSAAHTLRALHQPLPGSPWLFGLRPGVEVRLDATGEVSYRINADGFRDPERARVPPPGVFRIAVLGDSLAFGYGVEREAAFPALLERLLSRPEIPVEVLNLGVNGFNPYTEARLFEGVGLAYAPRLVLVQFCVNDLNDPTLHFDAQTRLALGAIPDAAYPDPSARGASRGWPGRLCDASLVCSRLRDLLPAGGAARRAQTRALAPAVGLGEREHAWLAARYGEIAAAATGAGARFAVVVFPHRAQLDASAPDGLQRDLAALAREAGWPLLDLLPAFRAAAPDPPLFLDAWHPSAEGHRVAAEAIAARRDELGLPPAQGSADAPGPSPPRMRATSPGA
jgi:lysophospholipase L1-like esterase